MSLCLIGDLITHSGRKREPAAIFQFGFKLPLKQEQDVPFPAPVVC